MGGEWQKRSLGELTENYDNLRVPVKGKDRVSGPFPYYGASGVVDYVDQYIFDGEYLLIAEDGENLRTRNTPIAFMARGKFWVNNHAHIVRSNKEANTLYLMYALAGTDISGFLTGSTMPKLTQGNMNRIPVITPPLKDQEAIACILGALDDKIELNRRMNRTLEDMARAIFKSWFVDFDPVRAKAAGQQPLGLKPEIADLFPDSLEDSELGEIPKGWRVGPLETAFVLKRGFDLPSSCRTAGLYPVIAASGPNGTHNEYKARGPGVTTGRSGVLGKVFYVHQDFWPLNTSLWVKAFKHYTPAYTFHFLQFLDLRLFDAGSAVPTLNRNHVHNLPILLPQNDIVAVFDRLSVDFLKKQKQNDEQSKTLSTLRDTLLPKLISGELRVPDAERIAGRCL
ncbi:MAG: restriction endonuclease subunit S [Desulfobacterales bacterium]|jgi:type I restriction enzyme S subunit|nr:restriction endonuclease subunit S [Desulfobacterales bacterium]